MPVLESVHERKLNRKNCQLVRMVSALSFILILVDQYSYDKSLALSS